MTRVIQAHKLQPILPGDHNRRQAGGSGPNFGSMISTTVFRMNKRTRPPLHVERRTTGV